MSAYFKKKGIMSFCLLKSELEFKTNLFIIVPLPRSFFVCIVCGIRKMTMFLIMWQNPICRPALCPWDLGLPYVALT